jgi:anti-sigma B factor antagonist
MSPRTSIHERPNGFSVVISRGDGQSILAVLGEVDVFTAPQLSRALEPMLDEGERRIVLDFAELEFIDGSGLRVIAATLNRCRTTGRELVIRSAAPVTLKLFRITGLAEALRIETPGSQACRSERANQSRLSGLGA